MKTISVLMGAFLLACGFVCDLPAASDPWGQLDVSTNLDGHPASPGMQFNVHVRFWYKRVAGNDIVGVKLTCRTEPDSATINNAKSEGYACPTHLQADNCDGDMDIRFPVYLNNPDPHEATIQVDGYLLSDNGKSIKFLDTKMLTVPMIRASVLEVYSMDYPKPPDTVNRGEEFPVVVKVRYQTLPAGDHIKVQIKNKVVSFGALDSWSSPALSGTGIITSSPMHISFNSPGHMDLFVLVSSMHASNITQDFDIEVVEPPKRVIGPIDIGYPKPPDTVQTKERTRFNVKMNYQNFPPGTRATLVFEDPKTGKQIPEEWYESRPLGGNGTYQFPTLSLTAPAQAGTWELDATIRLPKLNKPSEYETAWKKRLSLSVVSANQGPSGPPTAEITHIDRPGGTLKVNERAPIVVHIHYEKLGEIGSSLMAWVTEKGTNIFAGRADSPILKKKGDYTFPPITITAAHSGDFNLQVQIKGPNATVLASKWFTLKVIN